MIFVVGPYFAGKEEYIRTALGWEDDIFRRKTIRDVQDLVLKEDGEARDLTELVEELMTYEVVIATEVGGGIVPTDPGERQSRELAGRLCGMLAKRADTVIRVCCGLPQYLKGEPL